MSYEIIGLIGNAIIERSAESHTVISSQIVHILKNPSLNVHDECVKKNASLTPCLAR